MEGLSDKHARFVAEYIKDGNATQAAIRAGYKAKNADVTACKIMKIPGVQLALKEVREKATEATGITAERVIQELGEVAFGKPSTRLTWKDKVQALTKLGEHFNIFESPEKRDKLYLVFMELYKIPREELEHHYRRLIAARDAGAESERADPGAGDGPVWPGPPEDDGAVD